MKRILPLILAVLFFAYPAQAAEPTPQAITAYTQKLVPLRTEDVLERIHAAHGKPTVFLIYAAWCPHCRATFANVKALMDEGRFQGVEKIFLAIDRDFFKLSEYLLTNGYAQDFEPLVLKRTGTASPVDLFKSFGGTFDGAIPYFAFFGADNKLKAEAKGEVSRQQLENYLNQIK